MDESQTRTSSKERARVRGRQCFCGHRRGREWWLNSCQPARSTGSDRLATTWSNLEATHQTRNASCNGQRGALPRIRRRVL